MFGYSSSTLLLSITIVLMQIMLSPLHAITIDCDNPDSINEDHIHFCCKHPDGHNDIMEACSKETGFKLPSPTEEAIVDIKGERALAATCFGKCVFGKLKFMKGDNLEMEAVKHHYAAAHPEDPEYVKEMVNAFDHCHGITEENLAKFMTGPLFSKTGMGSCEPKPSVIWACVIREFFHNCPANRWSKTEECSNALKFSKQCKDSLTTM